CDAQLVRGRNQIMRMHVFQEEAHQTRTTRFRPEEPNARDTSQSFVSLTCQLLIVSENVLAADGIKIIHGRMQTNGPGNIRSTGLKSVRSFLEGSLVEINAQNHFSPALIRRH